VNKGIDSDESYDIHIDESDINRLVTTYKMSWNSAPDSSTLLKLIDEEIKAEIYYREAKRLNLQHNDEIIRRRLRQKYEFLVKDVSDAVEPNTEELENFYSGNMSYYTEPKKISFRHIYFKNQRNLNQKTQLKNILAKLKALDSNDKSNIQKGDSFHINEFQKERSRQDLSESFGGQFSESLMNVEKEGWMNDIIVSGFGLHLVRIDSIIKPKPTPYENIKTRLIQDWKDNESAKYNDLLFQALKDKYEVNIAAIKKG